MRWETASAMGSNYRSFWEDALVALEINLVARIEGRAIGSSGLNFQGGLPRCADREDASTSPSFFEGGQELTHDIDVEPE
jgi:hypothetical protein